MLPVSPPPINTRVIEKEGALHPAWTQTLTNWWTSLRAPANTLAPPKTSADKGQPGQIAFDQNFFYIYVGGSWKRIPLTAF